MEPWLKKTMKELKKKERICKYCLESFGDKVEMFTSLRHGHVICQPCFNYRQEHKLAVWHHYKN